VTDAQPAGDPDFSSIRAIALDTNCFSRGRLDFEQLESVVDRAENHGGVEVWVPEVVLWEWAEHAWQDYVEAESRLKSLRAAGLDAPALDTQTLDGLVEEMADQLAVLDPWLKMLSTLGAREALQDQVLQRPPASLVQRADGKKFKVGAADSVFIRTVTKQPGFKADQVLVISNDKGLGRAIAALPAPRPVLMREFGRSVNAVFRQAPTFEQATAQQCLQLIRARLHDLPLGDLRGDVTAVLHEDGQEVANLEADADNLELAGLSDLYMDRGDRFATGTLHLLADVTVSGAFQDQWGDSVVYEHEQVAGAAISVLVTVELEEDGPGSVTVDRGSADASVPIEMFHLVPRSALRRVLDRLGDLPLVEGLPRDGWPDDDRVVASVLGRQVELLLEGHPDEAWSLTAQLDGVDHGKVSCRRWQGQGMDEDWVLDAHTIDSHHASHNPFWGLNVALMAALEER
jgi:hypothetical protein